MFKKLSDTLNKSINNLFSQVHDSDESLIAPSGTVSENWCDTCKGKGCCTVCHETPCTPSIACDGKGCKRKVHYYCDPKVLGDKRDMVEKYYCPPCRKRYPKSRKNVVYFAASQQKDDTKSADMSKSENINVLIDVPSDIDSIVKSTVNEMLETISTVKNAVNITDDKLSKFKFKICNTDKSSFNVNDDEVSSVNESSSDSNVSFTSVDSDMLKSSSTTSENDEIPETNKTSSANQNQIIDNTQMFKKDLISSTPSRNIDVEKTDQIASNIDEPNISVTIDDSNCALSLSDVISNFSKELSNKDYEIFQLKIRIETLENEKFEGRFVPKEKRELESLKTENLELQYLITNQDVAIRELERKEESILERLNLAHEEVELLRGGLDELNKQLYLRPDHINEKNKQIIALKDQQLAEKLDTNNTLKIALHNANKEKENLSKNISDLSKSCINKKLLAIALEENETLNKQLELSHRKNKEAKPQGEIEINKLKDENAYFKTVIKDLENEVKKNQKSPLSPKNSPKKDNFQSKTRVFQPSNVNTNNNSHNHSESRGLCRYFPKCKWGNTCKWEHPNNVPNQKPRSFNSVPQNQQIMHQNQYPHQKPQNQQIRQHNQYTNQKPVYGQRQVPYHGDLSKAPIPCTHFIFDEFIYFHS